MKCKKEPEKYHVFEALYLDRRTKEMKFNIRIKLVAEAMFISESSARRWNTEMLNKLAVKLFGVDGLRLDI